MSNETISISSCPTCGAVAQALPNNKWRNVDSVHAAYDSLREIYKRTFGKSSAELSIPEVVEKLMWNADNEYEINKK
jgi:hypothetical protein